MVWVPKVKQRTTTCFRRRGSLFFDLFVIKHKFYRYRKVWHVPKTFFLVHMPLLNNLQKMKTTAQQLAVIMVLAFMGQQLTAQISNTEKKALKAFYKNTYGPTWNNSWNLKEDVSSWHGITVKEGHVVSIKLHNNGLKGSIPHELGALEHLEELDLAFNQLQGQLPQSILELPNLKVLKLEMNGLSGNLPTDFSKCKELKVLSLFNNSLEGTIPSQIGDASALKVLNLSSNYLKGQLPKSLERLQYLERLEVFGNELSGSINWELGKLKNLKELVLSYNDFQGDLPNSTADLEHLELVQLQGNQFNSVGVFRLTRSYALGIFDSDDELLNLQLKKKGEFIKTRMADSKFEGEHD